MNKNSNNGLSTQNQQVVPTPAEQLKKANTNTGDQNHHCLLLRNSRHRGGLTFLGKAIVFAIFLHLAVKYCPELKEKMPAIFGVFDQAIALGEYLYKFILKLLTTILNGESLRIFLKTAWAAFQEWMKQFLEFANSISF